MAQVEVLLLEDQDRHALAIRLVLGREPFVAVHHVRSAAEALELLSPGHSFDGLLSDWHLGRRTTAEQVIRAFVRTRRCGLCVVYSGDEDASDDALLAGAQKFLVKGPGTGDQLVKLLRAWRDDGVEEPAG